MLQSPDRLAQKSLDPLIVSPGSISRIAGINVAGTCYRVTGAIPGPCLVLCRGSPVFVGLFCLLACLLACLFHFSYFMISKFSCHIAQCPPAKFSRSLQTLVFCTRLQTTLLAAISLDLALLYMILFTFFLKLIVLTI